MIAYAVHIKPENFGAIASEKPDFNLAETKAWLEVHKAGYFLRDDESSLDCQFFEETVFGELYWFVDRDPKALFRRVAAK